MEKSPFEFIVELILSVVPHGEIPAALRIAWPILSEYAASDAILTDNLRAALQTRVLRILRAAGLRGTDIAG